MTAAVLGFAVVAGLMTLVPGLDTALVLRSAVTQGRGAAYATVAGISAGLLVWGLAAAIGISALLAASQLAYNILRIAGALYMVWLGVLLIRSTLRRRAGEQPERDAELAGSEPARSESAWAGFRRGFLTNLLNPKIGVFYIAVLPQFIPPDAPAALAGFALAMVHVLEGVVWFSVLILATQLLRSWLDRPAVQTWIDRITGGVLIGFGVKLALSHA